MTKVALITGGSRGLGRNAAISVAKKGIDSVITYNSNAAAAQEVVDEIKKMGRQCVALQLDCGKTSTFPQFVTTLTAALAETWKRKTFDFLVNNAGMGYNVKFSEMSEDKFDELMSCHLKGPYFLTQKLLPLIEDNGRVLMVSSGLTRFTLPGYSAYAAMKGGVEVLTKYLALELGARGIRVNVLAPGATETDFGGGMIRDNKDVNKMVASSVALGRCGVPDDIGPMVAVLLSEETGWVT
eukprot:gene8406-12956_t